MSINIRRHWPFIIPAALAGMALFMFLGGEVVKYLWNWLTPALFGFRQITFWQALGLLALCRILFGGFRLSGSNADRSHLRRRMDEKMADRMAERWDRMTPEEREHLTERLRGRFGFDHPATPS